MAWDLTLNSVNSHFPIPNSQHARVDQADKSFATFPLGRMALLSVMTVSDDARACLAPRDSAGQGRHCVTGRPAH